MRPSSTSQTIVLPRPLISRGTDDRSTPNMENLVMEDSKGASILQDIEAAGRKVLPMHKFLAKSDPATLDAFNQFLMHSIYREDGLPEAYKELVLACVCVVAGSSTSVIANHCGKSMAAGLKKDHLVQALEITAAVLATRTLATGINAVIAAEEK